MKNLFYLKLGIIIVQILLLSCNKEAIKPNKSDESTTLGRAHYINISKFKDHTQDFKSDPLMKLSQAVSMALNNDIYIRNQLIQNIISNDYREILLNDFFSQFNNNYAFNKLNFLIDSLYQNNKNDVLNLVGNNCTLLSLYITKEDLFNISDNDSLGIPIKSVFNQDGKAYAFIDDIVLENNDFVGIILRESQEHSIYDVSSDNIVRFSNSFEEFFGYKISDCSSIQFYIQNTEICGGNKVINFVKVFELIKNCFGQFDSLPDDESLEEIKLMQRQAECHRGEIEVGLREPQLNNNITNLAAFKLTNEAGFLLIDNQALPTSVFLFEFYWLTGRNGQPMENPRDHKSTVLRSDLVEEVYQYHEVFINRWPYQRSFILQSKTLVSRNLKYVPLQTPLFSRTEQHRHWRPDNQGEVFWITSFERKTQTTSGTNNNTVSNTTTIGGSFPFSIAKKVSGTLTFENKYTVSSSQTVTVSGVSVINLGNTFFEYCEPYPLIDNDHPFWARWRWLQYGSTGFIDIVLDSYWIP